MNCWRSWISKYQWHRIVFFLSFIVLWLLLTIGLWGVDNPSRYFNLQIILLVKVGLGALVFLGRYVLFPQVRNRKVLNWAVVVLVIILLGCQGYRMIHLTVWFLVVLQFLDTSILSVFLAFLTELVVAVYQSWYLLPRFEPPFTDRYWEQLRCVVIKLGILVTVLAILIYTYLIYFLLVDPIGYSYLLMIPILGVALGLYWLFWRRTSVWLNEELDFMDREIISRVDWLRDKSFKGFNQVTPETADRVSYLLLIRNYIIESRRPKFPWRVLFIYLVFCMMILGLPYMFQVVIEV